MKLAQLCESDHNPRTPAAMAYAIAEKLDRRFPAGEAMIAKSPFFSYDYAAYILKGRFPLGEKAIATNAQYALNYALYVLEDKFPEGEAILATNKRTLQEYKKFLKSIGKKIG